MFCVAVPGEVTAPVLPEPQSLHAQFNSRAVFIVTDADDDRLSANFWQTTFEADDPDMVSVDLFNLFVI